MTSEQRGKRKEESTDKPDFGVFSFHFSRFSTVRRPEIASTGLGRFARTAARITAAIVQVVDDVANQPASSRTSFRQNRAGHRRRAERMPLVTNGVCAVR